MAQVYENGSSSVQAFFRHLVNFLTGFLSSKLSVLETTSAESAELVIPALGILLRLSEIDDEVIFKICLEYWIKFVSELYLTRAGAATTLLLGRLHKQPDNNPRLEKYNMTLSLLRQVLIR